MASQDQAAREIVTTYNTANWTGMKNLVTPDVLYNEVGTQRRIQGPDAMIQALQAWKAAMPDSSGEVLGVFATGNQAALQVVWQGTQTGDFVGPGGTLPATGKHQKTPAAMILKFQGDKVSEIHHYFDMVTFLQQVGAMPAPASA